MTERRKFTRKKTPGPAPEPSTLSPDDIVNRAAEEVSKPAPTERPRRRALTEAEKARILVEKRKRQEQAARQKAEAERRAAIAAAEQARAEKAERRARRQQRQEAARLQAEAAEKAREEKARQAAAREQALAEKRRLHEEARRKAEEKARLQAEAEARRVAQENAKRAAEERKRAEAEEQARRAAEEQAAAERAAAARRARMEAERLAQEEAARKQAEEDAQRKLAEEQARRAALRKARVEAARKAEAEKRRAAEDAERAAAEKAAAEEAARLAAEEAARLRAAENALRLPVDDEPGYDDLDDDAYDDAELDDLDDYDADDYDEAAEYEDDFEDETDLQDAEAPSDDAGVPADDVAAVDVRPSSEPVRTEHVAAPEPLRESLPEPTSEPAQAEVLWDRLRTFPVDSAHLEKGRLISAARQELAHTAFDVLRTRLLQGLRKKGWTRVAITSPSKDCGKTFTASNLALALSRQENCKTALLDFDMRRPSLAKVFGVQNSGSLGDMLRGETSCQDHMRCLGNNSIDVGRNLAIGFNDRVEPYASELLQDPKTADVLSELEKDLALDVMLFDMPPALYHDDVMAARHLFDGVLLVVGGGITKPREVKDVESRLGAETPLLGTVLNFSEGQGIAKYSY